MSRRGRRLWAIGLLTVALAGCGATHGSSRVRVVTRSPASRCAGQPASLSSMVFSTAADGWVVAAQSSPSGSVSASEILATHDAGAKWRCQWRGALTPAQVLATDPEHGWMLAWQGSGCGDLLALAHCKSVVVGTRNGTSWSVLDRPGEGITQLAFASPDLGLAAARDRACREPGGLPPARCAGQVLVTTDGGRGWQVVLRTPEPIVAVAAGHGTFWAVESRLGVASRFGRRPGLSVLASHDAGRSWTTEGTIGLWLAGLRQQVQVLAGPHGLLWLSVLDLDGCAMHGCSPDDLWQSSNAGRTWAIADPVDRADGVPGDGCGVAGQITLALRADSVWAADGPNLATCERPSTALFHLTASSPRSSWGVAHRWASFRPVALAWPSPSVGYALGPSGLTRSTDAGRTWTQILPPASPAASLDATGPLTAYGAQETTDEGAVLETSTGGAGWTRRGQLPMDLSAVDFVSAQTGFATGAAWLPTENRASWRLYATANAGRSWTLRSTLPLSAGQQLTGLWMADPHRGLMLVSSGYIWPQLVGGVAPLTLWQTHDGGSTWARLRAISLPFPQTLGGASFIRTRGTWHGWLVDSAGLAATTDSGRSWHRLSGAPSLDGVDFVNTGFGVGWSGPHSGLIDLWRTDDGGRHWIRMPPPPALTTGSNTALSPVAVSFVTPQVGWLLADGVTWRTTNGARDWQSASAAPFGT